MGDAVSRAFRLSICIATYNRAAFIGTTLASMLQELPDDVEIVVVDGASTDATADVVTQAFGQRQNCRYLQLDRKGGVDHDYCRAVAEARGEYCWLMTDDDLLAPGAIATVLMHVDAHPDLLIVNAEVNNADFSRVLIARKMKLGANRDIAGRDASLLLKLAGDLLSFIGSVVIRKAVWDERDKECYLGSEFVHFGVIFQRPLDGFARLLAQPLVRIRYGNAQWAARAFEIWMLRWPELVWSMPGIGDDAKAVVIPREPWRHLGLLAMMKARGRYTWHEYRRWLADRPLGGWMRLRLMALAAFPDGLYNALLQLAAATGLVRVPSLSLELRASRFNYLHRFQRRSR